MRSIAATGATKFPPNENHCAVNFGRSRTSRIGCRRVDAAGSVRRRRPGGLLKGKSHFGDFLQSSERISTNILADRPAKLERHGLITKERDSASGRKVICRATQKARDLLPILLEIIVWSAKYDPAASSDPQIIAGGPSDLVRRTTHARAKLIEEILSKLE
jgi:DNA-binding HxlR family transcriptional regulator